MSFHRPVTPDLSIEALTEWMRGQDQDRGYAYQDPAQCLLGQYFAYHGAEDAISEAAYETIPEYRQIAEPKPHTFGAALQRAEKLLALPPPSPAFDPPRIEVGEPVPATGGDR